MSGIQWSCLQTFLIRIYLLPSSTVGMKVSDLGPGVIARPLLFNLQASDSGGDKKAFLKSKHDPLVQSAKLANIQYPKPTNAFG